MITPASQITGNDIGDMKRHLKQELLALKTNSILEAATKLFFEHGYSGTTLDAIAGQLQVTKPFIYSYFKNKEAILAAICETGISESLQVLDIALNTEGSYREKLIQTLWQVGDLVIMRQPYVVIYMREMKKLKAEDAERILQKRLDFDHKIAKLIDDGVAAGEFDAGSHIMDAIWIGGLISWLPNWYSAGGKISRSEVLVGLVEAGIRLIGATSLSEEERSALLEAE